MNDFKDILVKELSQDWINHGTKSVKASTHARYLQLIDNWINPLFGDYPVAGISEKDIVKTLSHQKAKNKETDLSRGSIRLIVAAMNSMLQWSGSNEKISGLPKILRRDRTLTRTEQKTLWKYFEKYPEKSGTIAMVLALSTGMRLGEICALQVKHMDFKARTICIEQSCQRLSVEGKSSLQITEPKTLSSIRLIPLTNIAAQYLGDLIAGQQKDVFVVSGETAHPVDPRGIEAQAERVFDYLDIRRATFHTLRHTFATNMIEAGVDAKTVSEILGHSNVNITLERYTHPSMQHKKKSIEKAMKMLIS